VAVTVDAGETLYLTVSTVSDMFVGFESRFETSLLPSLGERRAI
jgi:hypothetical protein